ncbi:unnamed protein product [Rotaria magnacalcarata]|uniref:Spt4/RpoE2 zinc finger domain-containing protein n=1 Tax=Rotaria magnacalcarata TaxID=392030 RepID=A0A816KG29_9BILA|nr:unnamed protein product [Rotaria magnacalcarata]
MADDRERIPNDLRNLRACLVCSLIKSAGNSELVYECTSSNFEGMIALMHPEESWVAKWQRIAHHVKGMYAISVTGTLPRRIQRELAQNGRPIRSRDVSLKT